MTARLSFLVVPALAALLTLLALGTSPAGATAPEAGSLRPVPAVPSPIAGQAMMLGAAHAGARLVAVGEQGIVLLSDDGGHHWRQARHVPVSATLTSVSFADDRNGWAVGHWGAVLATSDGGETWRIQRLSTAEDRPLLAVQCLDATHVVAVGLWSLVLASADGGRSWAAPALAPAPGAAKADANLLGLFRDGRGRLFAAGERGLVLRSEDGGASWTYLPTGYKGSLWAGVALDDGTLLVGGQRGTVYRSDDDGRSWGRVPLDSRSSVTGFAARDGQVMLVGLDGLGATSRDAGRSFRVAVAPDRLGRTAVLAVGEVHWVALTRRGPQAPEPGR